MRIYCISLFVLSGCFIAFGEENNSAENIHKLSGQRITLYTDATGEEIWHLPEIFDQAIVQMREYFHVPPAKLANWSMTGVLMKDKTLFAKADMLPGDLPKFLHGFSRNRDLWLYDQPSDYYRRHLLIHEGVHGFMNTLLGGCGPVWYMEGMAEMLATHRLQDGRLTLNYMPKNREEMPEWGRIRLIRDAIADNRAQSLRSVIEGPRNLKKETELYAWSWAAVTFLDRHPRYRDRFRILYKHVSEPTFNQYVFNIFNKDWRELNDEWQVFIAGLEYGHDISRTVIDFTPGKPLPDEGTVVTIAVDRGWQNTGVVLQADLKYRLAASGRYQVADKPKIWWCEPGGVSIRYYQGRPLGVLMAAVRPANGSVRSQAELGNEKEKESPSVFLEPITVGLGTNVTPGQTGTLYMRINDSAAELDDNAGEIRVEILRSE